MHPNTHDFSFNLFGFPTIIKPFFWLIAAFLTAEFIGGINNDMPLWITQVFLGMTGILLSILVHELGHALTFRHVFGTPCEIVLHGFGGMTIPQHRRRVFGLNGAIAQCFLAFSGPLAGFILAFFAILFLRLVPVDPVNATLATALLRFFLKWTAQISIFWGIFNLLPVYPLDGGHISREIFVFLFPRRGVEHSLILSMTLAILLVVWSLKSDMFLIALLFAYLIFQNYQEMSMRSFRR